MEFLYNFFIYGFIGWIIENIFSYYIHGYFQKDGFLKGPFKPMYAIAMAWILELYNVLPNIMFLIIISFIIPNKLLELFVIIFRYFSLFSLYKLSFTTNVRISCTVAIIILLGVLNS